MPDYSEKIRNLHRRAHHPETPPAEARVCRRIMETLSERYALSLDEVLAGLSDSALAELEIGWRDKYQREVLVHVAQHLGLEAYELRGSGGRKRKVILGSGPEPLLGAWSELCKFHIAGAERQLSMILSGYLHGAAPIPASDDVETGEPRKLDPEESGALRFGYECGLSNRGAPSRSLTMGSFGNV